jgi:hypothetical protein
MPPSPEDVRRLGSQIVAGGRADGSGAVPSRFD